MIRELQSREVQISQMATVMACEATVTDQEKAARVLGQSFQRGCGAIGLGLVELADAIRESARMYNE